LDDILLELPIPDTPDYRPIFQDIGGVVPVETRSLFDAQKIAQDVAQRTRALENHILVGARLGERLVELFASIRRQIRIVHQDVSVIEGTMVSVLISGDPHSGASVSSPIYVDSDSDSECASMPPLESLSGNVD